MKNIIFIILLSMIGCVHESTTIPLLLDYSMSIDCFSGKMVCTPDVYIQRCHHYGGVPYIINKGNGDKYCCETPRETYCQ
jgi:hypothetical protein